MDIVFIRDLEVKTVIGVFDWERKIRQRLIFNIELGTDISSSAKTDSLDDTLDYKAISHAIEELAEASSYQLVEALVEDVAQMVMKDFGVRWLSITLDKPGAVSCARSVGVRIERGEKW
jgi:7,8-dihydroneopterin aldolase/epimerase/oxygenase